MLTGLVFEPKGFHPETGRPGYGHYTNPDPDTVAYYTGDRATGAYMLGDGTVYNVSDHWIQTASMDHTLELDHLLSKHYEKSGILDVPKDESPTGKIIKWKHPLCDHCNPAEAYAGHRMLLFPTVTDNAGVNGITALFGFTSLHTGNPTQAGLLENANSGSYARQATAWSSASGGIGATSGPLTFATAGTTAVTYAGQQSSGTYAGGTYYGGAALSAGVTSASIVIGTAALAYAGTG